MKWSDPYGEFLAAKAARPIYELLGEKGIEEYSQPPPGKPLMNTLGFLMHDGGHGVLPADREVFLDFLDQHLKPDSQVIPAGNTQTLEITGWKALATRHGLSSPCENTSLNFRPRAPRRRFQWRTPEPATSSSDCNSSVVRST